MSPFACRGRGAGARGRVLVRRSPFRGQRPSPNPLPKGEGTNAAGCSARPLLAGCRRHDGFTRDFARASGKVRRRQAARQVSQPSILRTSSRIMLENRNLKLDLLALALLAAVIFLAAALFSYDPADPPGQARFPRARPAGERVRILGRARQPVAVRGVWTRRVLFVGVAGRVRRGVADAAGSGPTVAAGRRLAALDAGRDDFCRPGHARPLAGTGDRRRRLSGRHRARRCCKPSLPAWARTSSP